MLKDCGTVPVAWNNIWLLQKNAKGWLKQSFEPRVGTPKITICGSVTILKAEGSFSFKVWLYRTILHPVPALACILTHLTMQEVGRTAIFREASVHTREGTILTWFCTKSQKIEVHVAWNFVILFTDFKLSHKIAIWRPDIIIRTCKLRLLSHCFAENCHLLAPLWKADMHL